MLEAFNGIALLIGWVVMASCGAIGACAIFMLASIQLWRVYRESKGWSELRKAMRFYDEHKQD